MGGQAGSGQIEGGLEIRRLHRDQERGVLGQVPVQSGSGVNRGEKGLIARDHPDPSLGADRVDVSGPGDDPDRMSPPSQVPGQGGTDGAGAKNCVRSHSIRF